MADLRFDKGGFKSKIRMRRERLTTPTFVNLPGISVSTAHFLIEAEELLKSYRLCEICKCRVSLEGRGERVSVEEGETPLDPPLFLSASNTFVVMGMRSRSRNFHSFRAVEGLDPERW